MTIHPAQNDSTARAEITVELGSRSYPITIGDGLLAHAGETIKPMLARPLTAIITDENVARHHLATLTSSLDAVGISHSELVLPAGEATKSQQHLMQVCDFILEAGIERADTVIAFGGGVIGDLAGFAAAIVRRGVNFIQIPTSLLAQVDSSVGGKTAINSRHGKNLIGAFHQPVAVLADIAVLDTLPPRELAAGYAEVAKYGLLGDAGFFDWLEDNAPAFLRATRRRVCRPSVPHAKQKRPSWLRTSTNTDAVPCSIWVTRSAMHWNAPPAIQTCFCTVRPCRLEWRKRSGFLNGWA
jgi:3-dehydroquinate synthase